MGLQPVRGVTVWLYILLTKNGSISQFSDSDDAVAKIFFNINFTVPTAFSAFPLAAGFCAEEFITFMFSAAHSFSRSLCLKQVALSECILAMLKC